MTDDLRHGSDRRSGDERRATPVWFRLDAAFLTDDKIVVLGEDHGPAGPLVWVALLAAAKAQELLAEREGLVRMGWRQLRRGAYLANVDQARAIVNGCAELGLLKLDEQGDEGFVASIVGWTARQMSRGRAMTGAERTARWRQRKACDETSRGVTENVTDVTACDDVTTTGTETTTGTTALSQEGEVASANGCTPAEQAVAAVMAIFETIPPSSLAFRGCPVDVFAVEQQIVRHPGGDYKSAAREAIVRAAQPSARPPNLARLLGWELERQGERNGRAQGSPPVDTVDGDAIYARSATAAAGARPWEDQ